MLVSRVSCWYLFRNGMLALWCHFETDVISAALEVWIAFHILKVWIVSSKQGILS